MTVGACLAERARCLARAEVCAEGHALTDASLTAGDTQRYRESQTKASVSCLGRQQEEEKGIYRDGDGNEVIITRFQRAALRAVTRR